MDLSSISKRKSSPLKSITFGNFTIIEGMILLHQNVHKMSICFSYYDEVANLNLVAFCDSYLKVFIDNRQVSRSGLDFYCQSGL